MPADIQPNLPVESMPWARDRDRRLQDLERAASRAAQNVDNTNSSQDGILGLLTKQVVALQALTTGLQAQIDALLSANVNTGNVTATGFGHFGGEVTAGGNVAAGGNVTTPASVTGLNVYGTSIFAANAGNINGNITTARTQTWARNSDGYIGNTLSSIRFKTDVTDSGIDPLAVLGIGVKHYSYIAEVRKRDDPSYEEYVGPQYHVALEVGAIAEDLHAAGLWEFVEYQRETVEMDGERVERLSLDADGNPIPQSIHYGLWALAVLVATQHVWSEHLKARADIDRILAHLGI